MGLYLFFMDYIRADRFKYDDDWQSTDYSDCTKLLITMQVSLIDLGLYLIYSEVL